MGEFVNIPIIGLGNQSLTAIKDFIRVKGVSRIVIFKVTEVSHNTKDVFFLLSPKLEDRQILQVMIKVDLIFQIFNSKIQLGRSRGV
ncbi:hypothetical protein ALQ16_202973 [Pseudomonas syringae pv. actinidiae]|nr:hypothetical protein ALQ16_202973 [Pseudomonas syringae pv. actinidiae]